ncbi:MAG: dihydroorotase [Betaproteobacteria bacterium]|nr:dihydroorotase [Betaproteobacteria bacterium]MBU6511035.1 dihydroorotase [Betaproteobacteria bacterium]MDE2150727.1 dihydroorotase [Betaproteobacteria bacterium]
MQSPDSLDRPGSTLRITRPDDWHLHLRDGDALAWTVPWSAAQFARAIVMPNLKPPVVDTAQALAYRERVLAARPAGSDFQPLMTLYLTDRTPPAEIARARASGAVFGVKLYPAGATTNSDSGVTDLRHVHGVLEAMQREGMPLLVHGEVTDPEVDVFDREAVFLERHLQPIRRDFPGLKIVLEHITTAQAVDFVLAHDARDARGAPLLGATLTAHHLLHNRNSMFRGGLRPHYYCLPVLKRETHRRRLVEAACSGDARFFLGTDSAPHARGAKEADCGCAGCFSAMHALELYAQAFEQAGCLRRLEGFASHFGADFYGLPRNTGSIELHRQDWEVPQRLDYLDGEIVPVDAGARLGWRAVASAAPQQQA